MLTPSDIRNKRFEKAMGGYRVDEVHQFLGEVADQLEKVLGENDKQLGQLEILAEKVRQYREDEDSLRTVLIGAQKLGDSVVRDSKRKAETIIEQATLKAEEMIAETQKQNEKELQAFNRIQLQIAEFKTNLLDIYKQHIRLIQEIPADEAPPAVAAAAGMGASSFTVSIGENVEVTPPPAEAPPAAPEPPAEPKEAAAPPSRRGRRAAASGQQEFAFRAEPEEGAADAQNAQPDDVSVSQPADGRPLEKVMAEEFPRRQRTASRFGDLKFGPDYDLTRKE